MTSQRLTNTITNSSEKVTALRRQYSPSKITAEYGIDLQTIAMRACPTIDKCADVQSPMLCTLAEAYPAFVSKNGERIESTVISWMQGHIVAVSNFVNVKVKMTDWQMNELCQQLIADYPTVTMMEFVLFCARLRTGQYGSFFGTIDPLLITKAFESFMNDRNNDYFRKEETERKEREEREAEESKKNVVTWEQYCEMKGIKDKKHPFERFAEKKKMQEEKKRAPKETPTEILEQAKWVLKTTDKNIRAAFEKIFTKKFDCTPQEYIEQNRKKNEE
jgi:hypothetical protein